MERSKSNRSSKPPGKSAAVLWEEDLTGTTIGDFRVIRLLGEGGMGRVYLAEQTSLHRNVAIKMLRPDIVTPTSLARFRSESKIVAKLNHANIVQAFMIGEHQGNHYLVLEYVDGVSLRQYLSRKGRMELPLALSVLRRAASALQRAGELGVVHRDIKPENILITRKADVKVTDFGLARSLMQDEPIDLTRSGAAVGTPRYMSPEQVEGGDIDQRSDIYSLGVTFYEMLSGQPPFNGSNAYEIALKHVREEPTPLETLRPGIAPGVYALCKKMMAKKPAKRFASADELLRELANVRETLDHPNPSMQVVSVGDSEPDDDEDADPKPKRKASAKKASSRVWIFAAVAAGVLVAAGVTLAIVFNSGQPTPIVANNGGNGDGKKDDTPEKKDNATEKREREIALKTAAETHLDAALPTPAGVDANVELGVFYLEENQVKEAAAVFKRMSERRPPSAYHFVGRLGLAVVDAVKDEDAAAETKFKELFDSKHKDGRQRILNDYLKRNVKFEEWVNEADANDVRHSAKASGTKTPTRPSTGSSRFGKFFKRP